MLTLIIHYKTALLTGRARVMRERTLWCVRSAYTWQPEKEGHRFLKTLYFIVGVIVGISQFLYDYVISFTCLTLDVYPVAFLFAQDGLS